jgi:hypothetical protein
MVPAVAGVVLIFLIRTAKRKTHACVRYFDFLTYCFWDKFGGFLYLETAKPGVQKLNDNLKATSKVYASNTVYIFSVYSGQHVSAI